MPISNNAGLRLDGLEFNDLFDVAALARLDGRFRDELAHTDAPLHARLVDYRDGKDLGAVEISELLLALAPHLEGFLARLFGIETELAVAGEQTRSHHQILAFKKQFVQRRTRRYRGDMTAGFAELDAWLTQELANQTGAGPDREAAVARYGLALLEDTERHQDAIDKLTQWCIHARKDPVARARVLDWASFALPHPIDYAHLVPLQSIGDDPSGRTQVAPTKQRRRDGFHLTDTRMNAREVQSEIHYCVYCHDHDGDFCAKGFPKKKGQPELGLKENPLGVTLTGCPLEEKISEMHTLKRDGHTLAALAVAMVDNPMIPATGHRICNDCMKGCIYQKQDPVNIPQIETRVLTDVLALPWGVELYDLLSRWNPLRREQFLPKPYNGHKVLVSGMGPAGFTLAHHLSQEGCAVVGIDGLKIEPLPHDLLEQPVRDYARLEEDLDERILAGFGGVAEYGITVRWDKNFLKLIYLTLARRRNFRVFGGVRLGGTLTLGDAWSLGFNHVAIANGAGLPRVIPMENSLARGMRQASDFLMALQLTGAAKDSSLASLQVRLPAVVIGGGLTAVDTATEVQAYYVKQVEKTLHRYETLCAAYGAQHVQQGLDVEQSGILEEFLAHGRAARAERERARAAGETPDFLPLLREWGGVTLTYRRGMSDSPAYQRNHEEVTKAMQEGIYYLQGVEPVRAELDEFAHVNGIVFRRKHYRDNEWVAGDEEVTLPARAVFVAAGAAPNTIYEREYPGTFELQDNHFRPHSGADTQPVAVAAHCKADAFGPLTSYRHADQRVSFLGDTHPVFHGSVVNAIASAKRSYPEIMQTLAGTDPGMRRDDLDQFNAEMTRLLRAEVVSINDEHPAVIEMWVRAPMAARNFRPGQFFRLQTFETHSEMLHGTRLQIPLQTVSGAGVKGDDVRLLILRFGVNPRLIARLKPGDPLVLMGPTGAPAQIEPDKTTLVVAGKWGAAVMLDLGPALRAANNRLLMFAAFGGSDELYHQAELEAAIDQIVWCTAQGELIASRRDQDRSVAGSDVIELIDRYGNSDAALRPGHDTIDLGDVDEILVMGSTGLLRGLQSALRGGLKEHFRSDVKVLGTVGSPMQCMLKGVCAQCLQWQIDPDTGERTEAVFSCAMQDQPLFAIDLENLAARQAQNRLPDMLTSLWLEYVLSTEQA